MLIISEFNVLGEFDSAAVNINYDSYPRCPCRERIKFTFREYDALHSRDKFGEWADIDSDGFAS